MNCRRCTYLGAYNFMKLILLIVFCQVCICHPWNGRNVTANDLSGIP